MFNFIKNFFVQRKSNREAKKVLIEFESGKITSREFWQKYKEDTAIQNLLIKDRFRKKKRPVYEEENGVYKWKMVPYLDRRARLNPENLLTEFDINSLVDRCFLYYIVCDYLRNRRYNPTYNNADIKHREYLDSMLPSWVGTDDYEFLQSILDSAPAGDKKSRIKWCKRHCVELFQFDNKRPYWPANSEPEWPIIGGVPYRFSHSEIPNDDECMIYFYFYNPNNKDEKYCVEKVRDA